MFWLEPFVMSADSDLTGQPGDHPMTVSFCLTYGWPKYTSIQPGWTEFLFLGSYKHKGLKMMFSGDI